MSRNLKESVAHAWWLLVVVILLGGGIGIAYLFHAEHWCLTQLAASLLILVACYFGACFCVSIFHINRWFEGEGQVQNCKDIFRGLVQITFLGWAVLVAGGVASLNVALENISSLSPPPAKLPIWTVINSAAPDLARASVVALLVLFFAQVLKHYESRFKEIQEAANDAREAVIKAETITQIIKEEMSTTAKECIDVLKSGRNILATSTFSHKIAETLELAQKAHILPSCAAFSEQLNLHVNRMFNELIAREDPIELATFAGLIKSYLETETLNYVSNQPAGGGLDFSTRFAHYALAVRNVVDTLEALQGTGQRRFWYFTILNRTPAQFFNVENHSADIGWSVEFLEEFCRDHKSKKIPYSRYFLAALGERHELKHEPPRFSDTMASLRTYILCDNEKRPYLWGPDSKQKLLSKPLAEGGRPSKVVEIADRLLPNDLVSQIKQVADSFDAIDPQYIINDTMTPPVAPPLSWNLISHILPDYHFHAPQILLFNNQHAYEECFEKGMPRDLFAIWDSQQGEDGHEIGWRLCMGTMLGQGDPVAVTLIFATRKSSRLRQIEWPKLVEKLNLLFLEEDKIVLDAKGVSILGLDGSPVSRIPSFRNP